MRLALTPSEIVILLTKADLYDRDCKTKAAKHLIELGFYTNSGDKIPYFLISGAGIKVSSALLVLRNQGLL